MLILPHLKGLPVGSAGSNAFKSSSLDLNFAVTKSLIDSVSGNNLVTFTRASSGTFVGSDGLIKTATTNLLLRSEEFDNASWTKVAASITANAIVAPNGTNAADALIEDTANSGHLVLQTFTASNATTYTFSAYLQKLGRRYAAIVFSGAAVTLSTIGIDFDAGSVFNISGIGNTAGVISRVGSTNWYRVSGSITTISAGALDCNVRPMNGVTWADRNYTGDGTSGIYLWGAQLEQSSTVGEYIPTTSTINSAPRFDHNPTTGESLGLLVEEQRTNLALQSEDFATTWSLQTATVTTNAVASPANTATAEKLIVNNAAALGAANQTFTKAASAITYTFSVFAKASEHSIIRLIIRDPLTSNNRADVVFSLSSKAFSAPFVGGTYSGHSYSFVEYANGWVRVIMTATTGVETGLQVQLINNTTGDGTSGLFLWGAQLEAGAFPTSYIPTTTATVTRSADVASITGTAFSSWYRQDEGTIYYDGTISQGLTGFPWFYNITDGTVNNSIGTYQFTNGVYGSTVAGGIAATPDPAVLFTPVSGSGVKHALAVKSLDARAALGSTLSSAQTNTIMPVVNQLAIGTRVNANRMTGTIRRLTYWPRRLGNEVLQEVTR